MKREQCPKCGSHDIGTERQRFAGGSSGDRECADCGYVGHPSDFVYQGGVLTADRVRVLAERVLRRIEASNSAKDSMFRAGAVLMHDRLVEIIIAEIGSPAPVDSVTTPPRSTTSRNPWSAKRIDNTRFIVEHVDGRVLSQRRGRAQHATPIYFPNRAGAETRARKLNDENSD